ncbi:MAG: hypothetical protein U0354_16130 [Candidatus Sericytochromatia bacterium]
MLDNKVIVSINGSKSEHELNNLNINMPSEVSNLLALMQSNEVISKVSTTSMDLKAIIEDSMPSSTTAIVRQKPRELSLLDKNKEINPSKKYSIDEEMGIAMGVIVGLTKKSQINEIMRYFSSITPDKDESFYFYGDLTLSVFFDTDDTVSEMKFGKDYKGSTNKGLSIGDSVQKAIELYGQPKLKSLKGAIWNKFAIFCEMDYITSIRIHN